MNGASARQSVIDRRAYPRFAVPAAYTGVRVRRLDETEFRMRGHAYDFSEGGVRFEADTPIAPGTPVALWIDLPETGAAPAFDGPGRAVFVTGNVVWCDCEEPGPAQMALAITRFSRVNDRERLLRRIRSGVYARAA